MANGLIYLRKLGRALALTFSLGAGISSCATTDNTDHTTTGSIPKSASMPALGKAPEQMTPSELASAMDAMGKAYDKTPKAANIGIAYANLLQMNGRAQQALAVMQQVAIANPSDRSVLAAYGKAQAGAGQLEQALSTITRAQTPDRPDWRLYSAQGAVLDQLGRSAEARQAYQAALLIAPNEPTILSNLGMSYLLTGDAKMAETYLRNAARQQGADSRVRQNLALTLGVQGRFQEAEQIARQELSPEQAAANLAYLRAMLGQQNTWKQLAAQDKTAAPNAAR